MNNEGVLKNVILLPCRNILMLNVSSVRYVNKGGHSFFAFLLSFGTFGNCPVMTAGIQVPNRNMFGSGWLWYRNR